MVDSLDSEFRSLVSGTPSLLGPRTKSNMSKSLIGEFKGNRVLVALN